MSAIDTGTPGTPGTPEKRVTEYLRQRPLGRGQDPENISEIWFDAEAESIRLTASDLEEILAELDELRAAQEYLRSYTEDRPQEQGIRVLDFTGATVLGLIGGQAVEFHTANGFLRVEQTDDAEGLEISTPGGPRENSLRIIPKSTRAVVVQAQR